MPVTFAQLQEFRAKHQKRICIGQINVNSIRKEDDRPLLTIKSGYLDKLKLDIMCIQEAKVDGSTSDAELSALGYRIFREGRKKSGGTLVYAREHIPVSRIPCEPQDKKFSSIECVMLHVNAEHESLVLVCLYRRPSISLEAARQEMTYVLTIASSTESNVVVIGDINLCALGTHEKRYTELLEDLCDQFGVICEVQETTRPASGSCIDQVLASEGLISEVVVHEPGLSDHYMVVSALGVDRPPVQKRTLICRSFKNFDPQMFLSDINEAIPVFGVCNIFDSADDIYAFVRSLFSQILERHAPLITVAIRPNSIPWFNGKMAYARRMKHYWLNRAPIDKETGKRNHSCYAWERKTHWQKLERSLNREAAAKYFKDKCESESCKDFYRTFEVCMKSRKCKDNTMILLKDNVESDTYLVKDEQIANKFGQHFQSIGMNDESNRLQETDFECLGEHLSVKLITDELNANEDEFDFSQTDPIEVEAIIKNMKTSKAAGMDGIPSRAIKASAASMSVIIAALFNMIVAKCQFPIDMKRGIWIPVFKSGSRNDVSRYRPITILPHFSKIVETLMTCRFSKYVLPLLCPFQFAYKKNHNTESALVYIIENWKQAVDTRKSVAAVSLDLSAAFDSIPHQLLLRKLHAYGMSMRAVELMGSYLNGRFNQVKVNGKTSELCYEVTRGIPQGSQWGPLIWNVYLNDLFPMILQHGAKVVAYADDITYWITGDDITEIQKRMDVLMVDILKWFRENGLQPNPSKFQCIGLGGGGANLKFRMKDSRLENMQSIQLLGVNIDRAFTFENQVKKLTRTIAWKLSGIRRLKNTISRNIRWRLIQTYVMPHFDYVSSIYLFLPASCKRKMQTMHNRCLRMATRAFTTPIPELVKSLQTYELELRWHMKLFKVMQAVSRTKIQYRDTASMTEFITKYQLNPGYAPIALGELFVLSTNPIRNVFQQPKVRSVKAGERSLRFYGTSFWNKVPMDIRNSNAASMKVTSYLRSYLQRQSGITAS